MTNKQTAAPLHLLSVMDKLLTLTAPVPGPLLLFIGHPDHGQRVAGDPHIQYFNRQFGFVLRPARVPSKHEPYSPGLHHFCLRVDSAAEVHAVAEQLRKLGINATVARLCPEYAPDYTATFFEDPDGISPRSNQLPPRAPRPS